MHHALQNWKSGKYEFPIFFLSPIGITLSKIIGPNLYSNLIWIFLWIICIWKFCYICIPSNVRGRKLRILHLFLKFRRHIFVKYHRAETNSNSAYIFIKFPLNFFQSPRGITLWKYKCIIGPEPNSTLACIFIWYIH